MDAIQRYRKRYIITQLGELRRIRPGGTARLMQLGADNFGEFSTTVKALLEAGQVVLYKTPNHWERVTGENIPDLRPGTGKMDSVMKL